MVSRTSNDFGAPVGIYSAYLEAHQRGKERVQLVADSALRELDSLIDELHDGITKQYLAGDFDKARGMEKTLRRVKISRDKALKQRDRMLRRMDRQWGDAARGEIDAHGLKELKTIFYGDFLDSVVTRY